MQLDKSPVSGIFPKMKVISFHCTNFLMVIVFMLNKKYVSVTVTTVYQYLVLCKKTFKCTIGLINRF